MNKNLLAFFLACLTAAVLFSCLVLIHPALNQRAVQVSIRSDEDTHDIVAAVNALHRPDVDIQTMMSFRAESFSPTMIPFVTLALIISTGLILFFYKLYCKWLKVAPNL
jgi:hypothetical protein